MKDKIKTILQDRISQYEKAQYIIVTDDKSPIEIANEIIGIINDCVRC